MPLILILILTIMMMTMVMMMMMMMMTVSQIAEQCLSVEQRDKQEQQCRCIFSVF